MENWHEIAEKRHGNMRRHYEAKHIKTNRGIKLGSIVTPDDGTMRISLEYRDGARILIGRITGMDDQRPNEESYLPGNAGAVTAMAFLRARYAEPGYQLHISAWWRDYAYFCSALARGVWHMALHREKFRTPPQQCERCHPVASRSIAE